MSVHGCPSCTCKPDSDAEYDLSRLYDWVVKWPMDTTPVPIATIPPPDGIRANATEDAKWRESMVVTGLSRHECGKCGRVTLGKPCDCA